VKILNVNTFIKPTFYQTGLILPIRREAAIFLTSWWKKSAFKKIKACFWIQSDCQKCHL